MQKRSSKNTDINGRQGKLPAAFTKFTFEPGSTVFDYGCGRETQLVKNKITEQGCEYVPYDKYHGPIETLDRLHNGVDVTVCANLLNIIDDDETVKEIIEDIISNSQLSIFQIYEGNKSGIGKETSDDGWQRNETTKVYVNVIKEMGYEPVVKQNCILVS